MRSTISSAPNSRLDVWLLIIKRSSWGVSRTRELDLARWNDEAPAKKAYQRGKKEGGRALVRGRGN